MAMPQDKPTILRISRARKELIAKYAEAAGFLYGVIGLAEFVNVFNHYESDKTDVQEARLALERFAKTADVEYSLFDDCIAGPDFLTEHADEIEDARSVRAEQESKPRYLPDKDEFLRYHAPDYREPEKPYVELNAYILKQKLSVKEGLDGVDGDLIELHEMIQSRVTPKDCIEYFTARGYRFNGIDEANTFMQMVMNAHNNTRLFENNGFTPNELLEKFERPKLRPLPKEPFNPSAIPKVGRNEPCPCGSGKKYKKCHGY